MMELLEFVFQGPFHFFGFLILLVVIVTPLIVLAVSLGRRR